LGPMRKYRFVIGVPIIIVGFVELSGDVPRLSLDCGKKRTGPPDHRTSLLEVATSSLSGRVDRGGCGHARISFWDWSKRWLQRPERAFSCQTIAWGVVWLRIAWLLERSRSFPLPVVNPGSVGNAGDRGCRKSSMFFEGTSIMGSRSGWEGARWYACRATRFA